MKIGISLPVRDLESDLGAIRDFAQTAEGLGLTHLRVPDQVIRQNNKHLHEPLTLMAWLAGITERIELVPSIVVLPLRQTALLAKQAAEVDVLSNGRLRLGIGVGGNEAEYAAMGMDFHSRGARCSEQMQLLRRLWREPTLTFRGRFDTIIDAGINPLPVQKPIPMWIGGSSTPGDAVVDRIGGLADGWFVLATPEDYPTLRDRIDNAAQRASRDPASIGTEAGVAIVGPRETEWQSRVKQWHAIGLTHLCLRTLGGDLRGGDAHIARMRGVINEVRAITA